MANTIDIEDFKTLYATTTQNLKISNGLDIATLLQNEFNGYINIFRSLFVNRQNELTNIYNSIRNNSFPHNRVTAFDIRETSILYSDYIKGMTIFVNKLIDLKNSDGVNAEKIINNIHLMIERDSKYSDDIFGGTRNPTKQMDIDTAMTVVEYFSDIEYDTSIFMECIIDILSEKNKNNSSVYAEAINQGINMYINSIRNFVYKMMLTIVTCYNKILESIQTRTPVNGSPELPKYQLF